MKNNNIYLKKTISPGQITNNMEELANFYVEQKSL